MVLQFLRLFPQFRALESDRDATVAELRSALQEESTKNLVLQDRLDALHSDRAEMWSMVKTAIENDRESLKMVANYRVQTSFGVTPYPESSHLPESREAQAHPNPIPRNLTPSELVARARQRFVEQLTAK